MSVSNDMDEWTEEKCIQLIREFRKRPCLWNEKHNAYYKKVLKPAAWEEIAETVGMSEFCCRHKMGILLSSFRREKAKTINSRRTGDPDKYYYSTWFGFKYMAFLLDKKAESERRERIEQGLEEDELDEPEEIEIKILPDDDVEFVNENSITVDNYNTIEEINITSSPEAKKRGKSLSDEDWEPKQKKSKKKANKDTETSTFHNVSASITPIECDEEITHFSKYIAAKMKRYSETTKNAVQQAICEILFKADMAKNNFQSDFVESANVPKPFNVKISSSDSE